MFKLLSNEQAGRTVKAAIDYFETGALPDELEQVELIVFEAVRADIDRNAEKYNAICERNRRNGQNGGRPQADPELRKADLKSSGNFEDMRRNAMQSVLNYHPP